MTRIAWVLLALMLGPRAAVGQRSQGPDSTELRLLGLDLEADSAAVARQLGAPDSVKRRPSEVSGSTLLMFYRLVHVTIGPDGLKDAVTIVAPGPQTARGLRVGDSVSRLQSLYGRPPFPEGEYWRYPIRALYNPFMLVTVRGGRVARIYIGYPLDG